MENVSVQTQDGILLGGEVKFDAGLLRNYSAFDTHCLFWPAFCPYYLVTQANALLTATRLLSGGSRPLWGFLPPLLSFLQASQATFFLVAGKGRA